MINSKDEKIELRRVCRTVRDGIPKEERAEADGRILRYISSLASYRHAELLLFYAPIKSEVDVMPLMLDALEKGRRVALPLCESEPGVMTFRRVFSADELVSGAFGVREPAADAPIVGEEELRSASAFVLVPALAYDREGYRLGYGKGYYDRFLSTFGGVTVGACYRRLILDRVPKGFYDRKVQFLVCEQGVISTHD